MPSDYVVFASAASGADDVSLNVLGSLLTPLTLTHGEGKRIEKGQFVLSSEGCHTSFHRRGIVKELGVGNG